MRGIKCLLLLVFMTTPAACNAFPGTPQAAASLPPPAAATTLYTPSGPEIISGLDTYFTNMAFSGSVLITKGGKILLYKSYGEADRSKKVPNTGKTKFRIASITKQFTAMAILLLQSRGKLGLQERACDYLATCPPGWQKITIHHLLTHTSGLPDYYAAPDWAFYQATPMAPNEIMEHFMDKPLDFPPGAGWKYSNSGYEVLGMIIERVSGTTYETFIKENIFIPLNMAHSGYLEGAEGLATGYADAYTTQPANFEHPSTLFAMGGLFTTVNDLVLWDQALFTDRLIPQDLSAKMFTPYHSVPDMGRITGFGYGYGWFIGDIQHHRAVFHPGRIAGFSTLNSVFPDDGIVVVVLSNQWIPSIYGMVGRLGELLFKEW
jgi:CubicO group peptidase (beta-lactamase class C family)